MLVARCCYDTPHPRCHGEPPTIFYNIYYITRIIAPGCFFFQSFYFELNAERRRRWHKMKSLWSSLLVWLLLVLAAPQQPKMVTARSRPFGVVPTTVVLPPRMKTFFSYQRPLSLTSSSSFSSLLTTPRCGAAAGITAGLRNNNSSSSSSSSNTAIVNEGDDNNKKNRRVVGVPTRIAIYFIGIALFIGTGPAHMMLAVADGGSVTLQGELAAVWGLCASVLYGLGGCVAYASDQFGWELLLPGLCCELVCFYCAKQN
jgi:hypothetical protein